MMARNRKRAVPRLNQPPLVQAGIFPTASPLPRPRLDEQPPLRIACRQIEPPVANRPVIVGSGGAPPLHDAVTATMIPAQSASAAAIADQRASMREARIEASPDGGETRGSGYFLVAAATIIGPMGARFTHESRLVARA
jgi:hypothetical protein